MNYYVTIDGKKLDKRLLMLAENAVEGQGDGRISNADAQRIIDAVKDGNIYTRLKRTPWSTSGTTLSGRRVLTVGSEVKVSAGARKNNQWKA